MTNSTGGPGLRERKKLETRRDIRIAALDLATECGLERITVEMIAERAQISKRTFFNYFASKDEALITESGDLADKLRPLLAARPKAEPILKSLRMVLTETDPFELIGANRERSKARQALVWENPILLSRQMAEEAQSVKSMAQLVAERLDLEATESLRPMVLAGVVHAVFRAAVQQWVTQEDRNLKQLVAEGFDALQEEEI